MNNSCPTKVKEPATERVRRSSPCGPRTIAVTGASGFIGNAVCDALTENGHHVRMLVHERQPSISAPALTSTVYGSLHDDNVLDELVDRVDAVVHAASHVGDDTRIQWLVNTEGTRRLADAVGGADIGNLIYISTVSVYGGIKRNGASESEINVAPRSALCRTRVAAEAEVLGAGGTVVRPHMVFGPRDRWFLSRYIQMTQSLNCWINGGSTLVSAIDRDTLAALVADLATTTPRSGEVFHATYTHPVTLRSLALPIMRQAAIKIPEVSLSSDEAMTLAEVSGVPSTSQMAIAAHDNWVSSSKLWSVSRLRPVHGPLLTADAMSWYLGCLNP